ncbi:MAG: AAA family ATPase, partial [Actinomycetota bacterium]|nr:AAA family ATPase [Actinomycetota bacterium]
MLEREPELTAVGDAVRAAREGRGSVLLVEGPAGIGKTLLLTRAAEAAASGGLRALRASGAELERHSPFGVMRELFEPVLRALPDEERASVAAGAAAPAESLLCSDEPLGVPPQEAPFALVHAFYWLTANLAEHAPLLLCADDLHWADPASLRALTYLARRADELPLVIAAALRSGEPAAPELETLRGDDRARALRPRPLSRGGCTRLIEEEMGAAGEAFCRACHEATGGNPFLLRELLREIQEQEISPDDSGALSIGELVPESVMRSTVPRIARLGSASVALARALAVLESSEPWTAGELADLDGSAAAKATAQLTKAGVVAAELPLRFAHPLQRAAVYSELTPSARDEAHRRAASLLTEPTAVASQLLRSEPRGEDWAVGALRTAGRQALAGGSPEGAARALRRAVEEKPAREASADLLLELGQAELACGDSRSVESLEAALALARPPLTRAAVLAALGQARYVHGSVADALTTTRSALDELAGQDGGVLGAELLTSYVLAARASPEHADDVARLLEQPQAAGPMETSRVALRAFHGLLRGEPRASLETLARPVLTDPARGDGVMPVVMAAFVLAGLDDFAAADAVYTELLERARRRGSTFEYAWASDGRAWSRARQGMIVSALADCETLVEMTPGGWEVQGVTARAHRSELLLELGDVSGAAEALEISEELEARLPGAWGYLWLPYARSGLAYARGEHAHALAQATLCGRRLAEIDAPNPGFCPWRSRAALAAGRLGDLDQARELHREELRLARGFGTQRAIGIALRCGGLVEGGEHGLRLLGEAVQALDGSTAVLERARTLVELGGALRRARQPRA